MTKTRIFDARQVMIAFFSDEAMLNTKTTLEFQGNLHNGKFLELSYSLYCFYSLCHFEESNVGNERFLVY